MNLRLLTVSLCLSVSTGAAFCQSTSPTPAAAKVDFAQDVAPILRQNCVSCHGPSKQSGGMRLDRRSSALKPLSRRIVPGNTANSFLYHRIVGEFGAPMPPTGPLKPEEVATIKAWIEQGAVWPDALANDEELPPINPEAVAAVELLRKDEITAFLKAVTAKPALLNARGPEGSTPFMYATLYTDAPTLEKLIKLGADVNAHNDAHATAVMWAAHDLAKTAVLVEHGAEVNAKSDDFRTALMIAARKPGGAPIVKVLLEHGANPMPNQRPGAQSSPLLEAATAGDAASFELLLQHGAELRRDTEEILATAVIQNCGRCVELTVQKIADAKMDDKQVKEIYTSALQDTAFLGDTATMRMMIDHGADVKAADFLGRTALMYAAASDVLPLDAVKLLVAKGADVNAKSGHASGPDEGLTPLDMAREHGPNAIADFLVASGAKDSAGVPASTKAALDPRRLDPRFTGEMRNVAEVTNAGDIRAAIQASLPLLQQADVTFAKNSGCVSCHNNSLTAMTVSMARKQGLSIDEKTAAAQAKVSLDFVTKERDLLHQGFLIPVEDTFSENVYAYVLLGLHAEGYKADLDTDAAAMHILWRQMPDGQWMSPLADTRQPLCLGHIGNTALALRALQLYAPKTDAERYAHAVQLAAAWMATAKSYNNDDRGWRVAGLAWAGNQKPALAAAVKELVAGQKPDGGWSDLPSMDSSAYATGKSLVALKIAGIAVSDPVYQRGVKWLLANQDKDGSWYVRSRAAAFQPWSDAGFPHKYDQFISAAGTNWAAMALTLALPDTKNEMAQGTR